MCAASGRQGLPNLLSVWLNGKIVASSGAGLPASALRLCSPKLAFLSQSFAGVCDFFFFLCTITTNPRELIFQPFHKEDSKSNGPF